LEFIQMLTAAPPPSGHAERESRVFLNRRLHRRHEIKAVAKVVHGASALELPIRDISESGIGLESDAAKALSLGNLCLVVLPEHGKLDAMVVGVRSAATTCSSCRPGPTRSAPSSRRTTTTTTPAPRGNACGASPGST